ncbi:MAG TPA: oligosaccharide flippase family protein [Thermoleophilaceae bacterium]
MSLGRNVVASVVTSALTIGGALVSVPLIIDGVGTDGFGIWTIGLSIVLFLSVAEAGLGSGIMRFVAVAHGRDDRDGIARVAWTALGLYVAGGLVIVALAQLLAPPLASAFNVPARLEGDAETMFRLLGPIVLAALFSGGLANLQQGLERFPAYAVATALGVAAQVALLIVLLPGEGLRGVAYAALAQQLVAAGVRLVTVADVFTRSRPALLSRAETLALAGFSARVQMSAIATFANNQSDKLVLGVIAPATTVGQLGIGAQAAEAGRVVAASALNPLVTRMSLLYGHEPEALPALYRRLHRLWLLTVMGATVIALAALQPLIEGWLGDGHDEAALLGGFLVFAYGVNLLTGIPSVYLRAVGNPGLEARYATLLVGINVVASVSLGILAGAYGVVAATALAYVIGTAWFFSRARGLVPAMQLREMGSGRVIAASLVLSAAAVFAWGFAANALLPSGLALPVVVAGMGAAVVAHLSVTTGVRPTLANARALVGT